MQLALVQHHAVRVDVLLVEGGVSPLRDVDVISVEDVDSQAVELKRYLESRVSR